MGVKVVIGDLTYECTSYTVEEEASPIALGDSQGSVGTITFTFPLPENPDHPINKYTDAWLEDQSVRLADSRYGFTVGTVDSTSVNGALVSVNCQTRLGELNIYNVQAEPYTGTLGGAFEYYLSLAGIETDLLVDETIASRPVTIPGWFGELWFHLKELTAAQECDISLVSGVVLLRPIRARVAERGRDITRNSTNASNVLAQAIEIYLYETEEITEEIVYPIGGWKPETEVLNVNSGETAEYTLEMSASLSSIEAPVMQTSVDADYDASSVYTIVADDGLPVPVALWNDNGGNVEVTLNPDTSSLNVVLTGATEIPVITGGYSRAFSLALASDTSGSRYSTLRIVGTGVRYERTLKRIRTGVPESRAVTDVGLTIDNMFVNDLNTLYRAGTRAAKQFAGNVPSISGRLYSINRRGDTGVASYPSYDSVKTTLTTEIGGTPTYGNVQTYYTTTEGLTDYKSVQDYWFETVENEFANQAFGNVQGARIWDKRTGRWYRIRSATIDAGGITFSQAEDDLTYGDVVEYFSGMTYGDVQTLREGLTYRQEWLAGLHGA